MNNQKRITSIVITLIVIILLLGGLLIFQYFRMSKKEVKITEEKPILKEQPILKEKSVLPQRSEEERLKDFVFEQLVQPQIKMSREEFEREIEGGKAYALFEIFKKDLDNDGVKEIVIGATVPIGPPLSWIVVIRENNGKYALLDWKGLTEGNGGGIEKMDIENVPNNKYPAIVVDWNVSGGTGVFYEKTSIFHFINKQLKLTFEEYRSIFEQIVGIETETKENEYRLTFGDYDNDGNIDILQEGIETERKNAKPVKTLDVFRIFKWDENQKVFKLAEY
uniref:VCBS repeat-containing protein n=1 Tax=Dictyoglomus turgidum TaxID=513050 RepID=A0A7C3SPC2_9BACT